MNSFCRTKAEIETRVRALRLSLFVSESIQWIDATCLSGRKDSREESDDRAESDDDEDKPERCREKADTRATETSGDEIEERIADFAAKPPKENADQTSEKTHEGRFNDEHERDTRF